MAATQLAAGDTTGAVKAICLQFVPVDLYEDICFPGGVPCKGFVAAYSHFCYFIERNEFVKAFLVPMLFLLFAALFMVGSSPVDTTAEKKRRGSSSDVRNSSSSSSSDGSNGSNVSSGEVELTAAVQQHHNNWDMAQAMSHIVYKDDPMIAADGTRHSAMTAGIVPSDITSIRDKGVAVYFFAGYYDSGSVRSAARCSALLAAVPVGSSAHCSSRNKLTIGPWNHEARIQSSPFATYQAVKFDLVGDMKRFFDAHLDRDENNSSSSNSGNNSGSSNNSNSSCSNYHSDGDRYSVDDEESCLISPLPPGSSSSSTFSSAMTASSSSSRISKHDVLTESPVHYYDLGTERWIASDCWPIADVTWRLFRFDKDGRMHLADDEPQQHTGTTVSSTFSSSSSSSQSSSITVNSSTSTHSITFDARSGVASRWNLVQHILLQPFQFLHLPSSRILFTTPPLTDDFAIVGAPRLRVSLRPINGSDAVIFAYLLDIDSSHNSSYYLTEGVLRAACRRTESEECSPSEHALTQLPLHSNFDRSFLKSASAPLPMDSFTVMDIHFEPIAVTIFKGHRLQVALCGSDTDNFDFSLLQSNLATAWELKYTTGIDGCSLALPERL